jgi:glycosyltransferase involved in cell wall biosynthesis
MVPSKVANLALPNKVLQYLACGLPVVTFELPGLESSLKGLSALTIAEPAQGIWSGVEDMLSAMTRPGKPQGTSDQFAKAFSVETTIGAFENLLMRTLRSTYE